MAMLSRRAKDADVWRKPEAKPEKAKADAPKEDKKPVDDTKDDVDEED